MVDLIAYLKRARGGRVVQTGFLSPEEQAELEGLAQKEGLKVAFFGGFALAERKVAVLYPPEIPSVHDPWRSSTWKRSPLTWGRPWGMWSLMRRASWWPFCPRGGRLWRGRALPSFPLPKGP
jgi:hypothetical protein